MNLHLTYSHHEVDLKRTVQETEYRCMLQGEGGGRLEILTDGCIKPPKKGALGERGLTLVLIRFFECLHQCQFVYPYRLSECSRASGSIMLCRTNHLYLFHWKRALWEMTLPESLNHFRIVMALVLGTPTPKRWTRILFLLTFSFRIRLHTAHAPASVIRAVSLNSPSLPQNKCAA